MAQCPSCKSDLADGTVVCVRCGTNIESGAKLGMEVRPARKRRRGGGSGLHLTWPLIIGVVVVVFCYKYWKAEEAKRVAEFRGEIEGVSKKIEQSDRLAKEGKYGEAQSALFHARGDIDKLEKKYEDVEEIGEYGVEAALDELIQASDRKITQIAKMEKKSHEAKNEKKRKEREEEDMTKRGYFKFPRTKVSDQQLRAMRVTANMRVREKWAWLNRNELNKLGYDAIGKEPVSYDELRKRHYAYFQKNWIPPKDMENRHYTWFEDHWIPTLYYNRIIALQRHQLWSKDKKKWVPISDFLKTLPTIITLKSGKSITGRIIEKNDDQTILQFGPATLPPIKNSEIKDTKSQSGLYDAQLKKVVSSTNVNDLFELGKWWERARDCPSRRFLAYRCYEKALRWDLFNDDIARKLNDLAEKYAGEIASKSYKDVLKYTNLLFCFSVSVRQAPQMQTNQGYMAQGPEYAGKDLPKSLDKGVIPGELRQKAMASGIRLPQNDAVSTVKPGSEWSIAGKGQAYTIKKEGGKLNFYKRRDRWYSPFYGPEMP